MYTWMDWKLSLDYLKNEFSCSEDKMWWQRFGTKLSLWSPKHYKIVPDWKWRGSLFALNLLCLGFSPVHLSIQLCFLMNLWFTDLKCRHDDILKTEVEMVELPTSVINSDSPPVVSLPRVSRSSPPPQPSHDPLFFFLSVSFGFVSSRLSTSATDSFPVILRWFTFSETIS